MTKKVWLDAGHGGKDPGALGNGLQEKDVTLAITKKVGNELERHGIKVGYTRRNDKTVNLNSRGPLANKYGADVFVSIHTNAHNSNAQGVETYSFPGSSNGTKLAQYIHDEIIKAKLYTKNRGTKTANFAVLRQTKMPAALVELGFITNKDDASILKSKQGDIALAVAKGILAYLGISYNKPSTSPNKPTTSTYKGNSIVDYLKSIGQDSSFANRKKLAQANGIKNYTGTAAQNSRLLDILRNNKAAPKPKPKSTKPKLKGDMKTNSIVDYLKSINEDPSFANRKKLAAKHGIKNYKGTAAQNIALLKKLRI